MSVADPFAFERPLDDDPRKGDGAEKQAWRFPERFLEKARQLNEAQRERDAAWAERDVALKQVIRHLISLANNCKAALAALAEAAPTEPSPDEAAVTATIPTSVVEEPPAPVGEPAAAPPAEDVGAAPTPVVTPEPVVAESGTNAASDASPAPEPTAPEPPRSLEVTTLSGINRTILDLLEKLGVYRVELLGSSYEDVVFDGQRISDPFEVEHTDPRRRNLKRSELRVREVISDLWVSRRGGAAQVLYRGRVNC
jgi:hypothetical protein